MKILHIFGRMDRGGAEIRTLELMRKTDRNQFQFHFCALSGKAGSLDAEIRNLGGMVHYCDIHSPLFCFRFLRLLKANSYHIVHSHVYFTSGFILMLASLGGVPGRIAHFRSSSDGKPATLKRRIQKAVLKYWIARHASYILAVGQGAMEASWGAGWINDSRCAVIPNGLCVEPFAAPPDPVGVRREFGMPDGCALITHIGRMSPPKNHLRVASMLCCILSANPGIHALFVGQENEDIKQRIIAVFNRHGISGNAHFAGLRNDIPRILLASDLLLFPSLWEGSPGAVLEACAAGTPVLASAIPGICELTATFPSIQCVPLIESNEAWSQSATRLLARKPATRERDDARRFFESTPFHVDNSVAAFERLWSSLDRTQETNGPALFE